MPRKPLSEAAKKAFARSRKLYWIRKKLDKEEKALRITAPIDSNYRRDAVHRRDVRRKTEEVIEEPGPLIKPFGEEEFEREMGIRWKRDE